MKPQTITPQSPLPTLIAAFLHFDLSFMLWVLLGALGIYIAESMG
jgi:NNP family nitrate/nitrite transporter-like MFS transporter